MAQLQYHLRALQIGIFWQDFSISTPSWLSDHVDEQVLKTDTNYALNEHKDLGQYICSTIYYLWICQVTRYPVSAMDLICHINTMSCGRSGCNFKSLIVNCELSTSFEIVLGCIRRTFLISRHWFREWLGAFRQQTITKANVDPNLCYHMASINHTELTRMDDEDGWTCVDENNAGEN